MAEPLNHRQLVVGAPRQQRAIRRVIRHKVKTGCTTCKIRKIKCDEAKPACVRCTSTGRKCDGYTSTEPVKAMPVGRRGRPSQPGAEPLRVNPAFHQFQSKLEANIFHYYQSETASSLSSAKLDMEFWGGIVLRIAPTEPAVSHAVTALGILHGTMTRKLPTSRQTALIEYGKAITAVRNWPLTSESSAMPLLVCLLFICIEFMLGDTTLAAQLHMVQGRKIILSLPASRTPTHWLVENLLAPIFRRLSLASTLFPGRPSGMPRHLLRDVESPVLESVSDAGVLVYTILDEAFCFATKIPAMFPRGPEMECADQQLNPLFAPGKDPEIVERVIRKQLEFVDQMLDFARAFRIFTDAGNYPEKDQRFVWLLWNHYYTGFLWLRRVVAKYESEYDLQIDNMEPCLEYAQKIIEYDAEHDSPPRPTFTFETELIAPLYCLSLKSRHPIIRRRALRLLSHKHRRERVENHWSSKHAISLAVRVLMMEEEDIAPENLEDAYDEVEYAPDLSNDKSSTGEPTSAAFKRLNPPVLDQGLIRSGYFPSIDLRVSSRSDVGHTTFDECYDEEFGTNSPSPEPARESSPTYPSSIPRISETHRNNRHMVPDISDWTIDVMDEAKSHVGPGMGNWGYPRVNKENPKSWKEADSSRKFSSVTIWEDKLNILDAETVAWPQERLVSPFGIPLHKRVLNVIIHSRTDDGVWATFIREPLKGSGEWKQKTEYVTLRKSNMPL